MSTFSNKSHHERSKIAFDRPKYREGNQDRAVKVFTINKESAYLLIQGVPDIKITRELLEHCALYGTIDEYKILDDYPTEAFTKVYWIKYQELQAARIAKRKLDDYSFYGGVLHVCYAPEYETVSDTRVKLQARRKAVAKRLRRFKNQNADALKETDESEDLKNESFIEIQQNADVAVNLQPRPIEQHEIQDARKTIWHVKDNGFPWLPDPPRNLPCEKWKYQKSNMNDEKHKVPSAHSTLPDQFNPYPDGYEPKPPKSKHFVSYVPQTHHSILQHQQELKFEGYCDKSRPKPPQRIYHPGLTEHSEVGKLQSQFQKRHTVDLSEESIRNPQDPKTNLKFVPASVTKKRTATQANLSTTQFNEDKRVNSGLDSKKTGITFYRKGKSDTHERLSASDTRERPLALDESCSFTKTVHTIRNKMNMVSKLQNNAVSSSTITAEGAKKTSTKKSSNIERIRI